MKIYQLLLTALVAVLFVGCSANNAVVEPQAVSLTDTLKNFIEASKKKDIEAVKKTFSVSSLALVEMTATAQNTTVDELLKRGNSDLVEGTPDIRNEKIENTTASVEVKNKTGNYETIPFVNEDGTWKIAFDKYQLAIIEKARQEMSPKANSNSNVSKPDGNKPAKAPANKPAANK